MQKTCIIIPCYNETERFDLSEFNSFYDENSNFYFILVNDASTDSTYEFLSEICRNRPERTKVINQLKNTGKAEAVRSGILQSLEWQPFDYVGYFDADFSTSLYEIKEFTHYNEFNIILGSRIRRLGAVIDRSYTRYIIGRVFATIASSMLKIPVYDTQCGAKIFKREIAAKLFEKPLTSNWLFDVELLFRYMAIESSTIEHKKILEFPLKKWIHKANSKIKYSDFIKIPIELLKLYFRYKLRVVS